jgi:two-component system NtrC family sensor kinase
VTRNRLALLAFLRALGLVASVAALHWVGALPPKGFHAALLKAYAAFFVLGSCLPRLAQSRPSVAVLLLAGDLIALGGVGTFLELAAEEGLAPRLSASIPFLSGFLVAVLVAATGRRSGAATLGALAGAMVVALTRHTAAEYPALAGQVAIVIVAAIETAVVMGWLDSDVVRRRASATVEREIRAREALAGEISSFLTASATASSLADLAESTVAHLRRYLGVRARAVALDSDGERVALWEEAGRLDEDRIDARRQRLEDALHEAGSSVVVDRLEARSTSGKRLPARLGTFVSVPIHGGGRVAGVLVVADPSRHVLAEERIGALAEVARHVGDAVRRLDRNRDEQTRRTSILLGQMHEGVLLLGPDGRVLLSNPAGRDMLEALGQSTDRPVTLGPATPDQLASVAPGRTRRYAIHEAGTGGEDIELAVAAIGVMDGGCRLGTLVTMTDVSEEERARRRLVQAEKLSVVGQTLAGVAHELNNPLAALVGYADLLNDRVEGTLPAEVERLLGRIQEQALRASRIVRNLLNVVRKRAPERARLSLSEVAQSLVDLFAYDARLSNIDLVLTLDPDLPAVLGDRHAIQQILVNLVRNSIQAVRSTGRGGRVEVRTHHTADHVCATVRDDGPGVPLENRGKVFEAFFTTKAGEEGTGLGLAVSRGIAREHQGDLVLDSSSRGASFTLRLPVRSVETPDGEHGPLAGTVIPDGLPSHVLVVDDEAPVREALAAQLARMGARVDTAGTGEEAVRLLSENAAYDAVLMDVRLQGTTGIEIHRGLRTRNPQLAERTVFMTGDLVNDGLLSALRATGNAVLEKPFTADELRTALAKAQAPRY